ncbi:hypothetical protein A2526_01530 [candidate division WOR-1 bacterium RIFOXYD2_FULL_36_8]|nr:MAG: hypothetical protein A2526_01530 [candidate division WOR-1 bacterium RIFOXYD2_FULL_36_8]
MCAPRKKQDDSKKVIHMPYPLFLKALAQLTSGYSVFSSLNSGKFNSEKILRLHDFGDPFLWRDKSFSADFGDLALKLDEAGFVAPLISTHGRLKKDVFSKDALEKYGSSHPGRSNLSVHLFNKNIFPNSYDPPNTFLLSREAFRIKRDIEALLPSGIDFITNDESHSNPFLRKSFLLDFYERRVVALLSSDELKDRYSYHGGKTIFRILPVISAGAAVRNNGYFVPSSSSSFEFQGLCYAKADVFGNLSVLYQFNSSLTESFLLQKMYDFEEMGRFS